MESTERILFIDDESIVRGAFARGAKSKGYVVDVAENLETALELIKGQQYGVIAVDYRLSGNDGLDVVDTLTRSCPLSTFVLVSGQVDLQLALAAVNEHGVSYVIRKPWDNDELGELLGRSMDDYSERIMTRRIETNAVQLNKQLEEQKRALQSAASMSPKQVAEALLRALSARGHETQAHCRRVSAYSVAMGEVLGVKGEPLVALERGALLHDIGTIAIPDAVYLKAGKLTDEEWATMRTHPEAGMHMLDGIENLRESAQIVLQHHELWDGTGYPHKRKGDAICLGARIFSVADALDAMTSRRTYHKTISFAEAIGEICKMSGARYDPNVVEALQRIPISVLQAAHDAHLDG